jgi:hypothetical protein
MTNGEREIVFQMQQLQSKWIDAVQICSPRPDLLYAWAH